MNERVHTLIPAVVHYVTSHDGYVTKTKLLKLLYLFDVEYYRFHRSTFTGFQWKYFHLGPWTGEFDSVLQELVEHQSLYPAPIQRPDFDTTLYRSGEATELGSLFSSATETAMLRTLLDTWGSKSTAEILDHVYFQTEPMEHGVRNTFLDFSNISNHSPEIYKRAASGKPAREIERMRRDFTKRMSQIDIGAAATFTPPRYDEEFQEALEKLDSGTL